MTTDPTKVTVQCSGETDLGRRCDRTLTVHVHFAKRDHYCYDHTDEDGDGR
jgi:hypothetical protein